MKTVYIIGIILTFIPPSRTVPPPGKEWYDLAYKYLENLQKQIDERPLAPTTKTTHGQETVIEKVFENDIHFRSLLEYAINDKTNIKQTYRNGENSFGIEKNRNIYKLYGNIPLKQVFSSLQHYCNWDIDPSILSEIQLNIGGKQTSFALNGTKDGQITIYSSDGKRPEYKTFTNISVLEEVPGPSNLAGSILNTLETPLNKQRTNIYLGTNDKIRNTVVDFLTITHIAEAAVPSPKAFETVKKGIDIVRKYKEDIKKELDTGKLNKLEYNKNEEIKTLINEIEKRGRIPLIDKMVRKRLREIKEGNMDFRKAFSDEMYILRTNGGIHLGQIDILKNHAEDFFSDEERPIPDLLKTEKQQQISTIEARKDEQNTLLRKRIADEMKNVESKRRKLCNNRRRKRSVCRDLFDRAYLKIDTESIVLEEDKIRFALFDSRDESFQHESEIKIKQEELVYEKFIEHLAERGLSETSATSSSKINRILGIYGIVAGIGAATRGFDNDDNIRGSLFISQSTYIAGNIVEQDRAAGKLFDLIGSKVLSKVAIKLDIEKVVQRLTDKIATSAATRFLGFIPMVGVAFDVFSIEEDVRDLVNVDINNMDDLTMLPLKVIPLETDLASTILNLAGSEMEPIVLALTIFRMPFDDYYIDIYKELKKVDWNSPCNATALQYSTSSGGKNVNLKLDIHSHVVSVVGSPFADRIYGNSQNNILDTGGGSDFLFGGNGSDTYLIRNKSFSTENTITIDNRANDKKSDILILEVSFSQITPLKMGNDLKFSCSRAFNVLIKKWFIEDSSNHMAFISGDHVMFNVAMRNGKLTKSPSTIDLSQLLNGVQLDMQNKIINGTSIHEDILPHVHTVSDSPYNDIISGNSLDNFLSCSGGNDILQGNAGMDRYIVTDKCKGLEINNYDDRKSEDMLFVFTDAVIGVIQSRDKHSLIITRNAANGIVLRNWFKDAKYRHLTFHLKYGVVALPEDPSDLALNIVEINKDIIRGETIDMEKSLKRLKRVHFTSDKKTYNISGNALNNFFHLGPSRNPQYIAGRNGTDIYEVDCGDGKIFINNFANDLLIDHLKIGIFYDDLEISQKSGNTLIKSRKMPKNLTVEIEDYCKSVQYQHLQIHTTDGVSFKIVGTCDDMHIHVLQMDMSRADSSQNVSLVNSQQTKETRTVYGSLKHNNVIDGNDKTNKLVGGTDNDEITGNNGNDWIEGGAGNDILKGGNGDDVIFGGDGDDLIYGNDDDDVIYPGSGINTVDGGHGIDTVVLKGDSINKRGVYTNLQEGFGSGIDAENNLYISIENAIGSEFNDTLVGSDTDNLLRGYGGEDTLIPLDGNDYLFGGEAKDTFELTNATGLKTIDNYAKDQIDDIFVVQSSLGHDVCSFRYNKSLHLSFPHGTTLSARLDVVFHDWYEGGFYQHAKFQLKDTLIRGDTYLGLDNEEQTSHMLDDVTISSTYKNGRLLVSWDTDTAVQQLIAKGPNRVMLAYREMTKQKYTVVTIDNATNFTITDLSNNEIRLLYVRCGKVLGFTKSHHAFSFVYLSVHLECHERHRDCYITKHFKLKAVPLRRGWLLDWITNT